MSTQESMILKFRQKFQLSPSFFKVDTCMEILLKHLICTPLMVPNFDTEDITENKVSNKKKVIILGGGPNRIGQGIEFDYCCVHGILAI